MRILRPFILSLLCFLLAGVPGHAEEITLTTHNLCPYGCYDANGNFDGHAVRVVRYALKKMGVGLNLVVVPWKRAQNMVYFGEADGFFAASNNAERDKRGVMSATIAEQTWTWYLLKDNPLDPGLPNFKKKARVTSFVGANMLTWLKENSYNVVSPPPTTDCLADMLLAGRFDAMLGNDQVMKAIMQDQCSQELIRSHKLMEKPLGVVFSNQFVADHPGFVEKFNQAVKEYRKRNH